MGRFRRIAAAVSLTAAIVSAGEATARTLIRDAEIERTLERLSAPIFKAAGVSPDSVRMHILLDDNINAFVIGGRTMVLNTGLLRRLDEPRAVMGVIAHETGHITGGHIARRMQAMDKLTIPMMLALAVAAAAGAASGSGQAGAAVALGGSEMLRRTLLAYSRGEESAADQAALSYMTRAGVDPQGLLDVLQLFRGQEVFQSQGVDPYALTHPLSRERLSLLERGVAQSPALGKPMDPELRYWFDRMQAKIDGFVDPPERTLRQIEQSGEPDSEVNLLRRAIAHHRRAERDKALAVLDRIMAKRPDDPYYWALRGQFLFEGARPAEAVTAYRRALRLAPDEPLIAGNLGRALLAVGGPENEREALRVLEAAVRDDGGDAAILRDLSVAHSKAGNQGLAALAAAERLALLGQFEDAGRLASRAMGLLPTGSPGWQRADDLLALARIERSERR
jgi:predicted Zn-dependent protease